MDGTRHASKGHSVVEREQRELRRPGWAVSFKKHIRMCCGLHFCCCCWRSMDWGEGDTSQTPEPGLRLFWSQFIRNKGVWCSLVSCEEWTLRVVIS